MNDWWLVILTVLVALQWIHSYKNLLELRGLRDDLFYPPDDTKRKFKWLA